MIDSVLKGNGNSRFLKSAVPAGTSWADALAMLQAGTFPIDFNGINAEGFQQVGTPLNKANLLKDATAAQIGLPPSTTPDGMFQALGNTGELHVWRKTVKNETDVPAGYNLGVKTTKTILNTTGDSGGVSTIYYSSSVSVSDSGEVSLKNPASTGVNIYTSSLPIVGKFFYIVLSTVHTSDLIQKKIYFVPADTDISVNDSPKSFSGVVQEVTGYPKIPAGTTTTYPVSTNPNAYQEGSDAKPAGYTLGEPKTTVIPIHPGNTIDPFYYGDANNVAVTDDGVVSVSSGTYVSLSPYNTNNTDSVKGKYIQGYPTGYPVTSVYYIPADATFSNAKGDLVCDKAQLVTGYAAIPAVTTIEYLGKLGDKARVQVVSYVGTGTYGHAHPTTVTFDIVPKIVFIAENVNDYPKIMTIVPSTLGAFGVYLSAGSVYGLVSPDVTITGKRISFFSANSSGDQMNNTGNKYFAIAIG